MVVGTSCVFSVGWKATFADLFGSAPGVPTAPTGVERESGGSPMEKTGKEQDVGLGLGLGLALGLGLSKGLVAESLTAMSLVEKSK